MIAKKPCKNDTTYTYTGKEMSPLGLGYSASAEQVGSIMTGRDQTMWMVGIKNGVKVWNRIPTEIAAAAAPLEKDPPVLGTDVAADEAPKNYGEEMPKKVAPKKKVATKKKEVEAAEVPVAVKEAEEEVPEVEMVQPPAPPAKKKVVRKKAPTVALVKDEETAPEPVKPKRKPTTFNIFMAYRMKTLAEEEPSLSHKDKFGRAAAEWREMDDAAKKVAVEKATATNDV